MGNITQRSVLSMFFERLMQNAGSSWIEAISTPIIESDQDSEDYAWLGMVPQMSELHGAKSFSELREVDWIVRNKLFQGGLKIPKNHILYDKTGQVAIRVNELADRAMAHWVTLIAPLILNGATGVCYDGDYFFGTAHSEGDSGVQSNSTTFNVVTPTAPTPTEFIDAILSGVENITSLKDDKGEYVNEDAKEFLVLVGTPLMGPGLRALSQSLVNGGDTNILIEQDSFRFRVQSSPRFSTWTDRFAIFSTEGQQKPIIRQQRIPNENGADFDVNGLQMNMLWTDSEHYKLNNECLVSVETERAAAYGDWKKANLVTLN